MNNEKFKITRNSNYWDSISVPADLFYPIRAGRDGRVRAVRRVTNSAIHVREKKCAVV